MDDPARSAGGALGEYAYQQGGRERPMTEVLKDIIGNVQEMVRSEVRLARVEIRDESIENRAGRSNAGSRGCAGDHRRCFPVRVPRAALGFGDAGMGGDVGRCVALGIAAAMLISKGRARSACAHAG